MSDEKKSLFEKRCAEEALCGAAADSADGEENFVKLPRLLRYALATRRRRPLLRQRLVAEICSAIPDLAEAVTAWAEEPRDLGEVLICLLDAKAVTDDRADLRSYADVARLLSTSQDSIHRADQRRVALALALCETNLPRDVDDSIKAEIAEIAIGWAIVAAGAHIFGGAEKACDVAELVGVWRTKPIEKLALVTERKRVAEAAAEKEKKEVEAAHEDHQDINDDSDFVADGCVRVCTLSEAEIKNAKLKDILRGHEHIVGADVPLAATPDLRLVRRQLLFEFPYAENVIDFALADLVGCEQVRIRPLLAVGKPGCGKSRFMRRLGETLGVGVWRTDAAQIDGSVFAGTAKRWASAEPSHAFLAVSRAGKANPLVIVDELEKAGTRSDYGRFWDSFLGFLEPETSAHYPDPALQTALDLSHVCYVATANSLAPLPSALLDRFRVMAFPEPRADDLDALLSSVLVDIARERGLDARWVTRLVGWEHDIIAKQWGGGSVRRLRRFVETVIRARERDATLQ